IEVGLRAREVELALRDVALGDIAAPPADGIRGEDPAEDVAPLPRDGHERVRQQDVVERLADAERDLPYDVRRGEAGGRGAASRGLRAKDALGPEVDRRGGSLLERRAGDDGVG